MSQHFEKKDIGLICFKIAVTVFIAEWLIMLVLPFLGQLNETVEGILDAASLTLIITPIVAFYIIRPYVIARNQSVESLRKAQEETLNATKEKQDILARQKTQLEEAVERAIHQLKVSEERYSLAAQAANDGLWDLNLETNQSYFSPRFLEIVPFFPQEYKDAFAGWLNHIHPDDLFRFQRLLDQSKEATALTHYSMDFRICRKEQEDTWILCRWLCQVREEKVVRLIGSISDISIQKNVEAQLTHDAYHDHLTSLPNRLLLKDRIDQALNLAHRNPQMKFAVLFIDLDNFKQINDRYGHQAGDDLLITVAKTLKERLRNCDTVARLGGDEFAVLLQQIDDRKSLDGLINTIGDKIQMDLLSLNASIDVTLSIGAVFVDKPTIYPTRTLILSHADIALYEAKERGKDNYYIFEDSLLQKTHRKFEIHHGLSNALTNGEISIFYQPVVSLETSKVIGFESLMRWKHPKLGFVSPFDFIHVAEEHHLISDLGVFCLKQTVDTLIKWQHLFPDNDWFFSLNVSAQQLQSENFINTLKELLLTSKISTKKLRIEVDEEVLLLNRKDILERIGRIRAYGIHLVLDNFGNKISSLYSLSQFDFSSIKIDRTLLNHLCSNNQSPNSKRAQQIFKMTQAITNSCNIALIYKGIENQEHLEFLKNSGVSFGQGYFFSQALEEDEITTYLQKSDSTALWDKIDDKNSTAKNQSA